MEPNERISINIIFWKGPQKFILELRKYNIEKKAKLIPSVSLLQVQLNVSEASQLIKEFNLVKRDTVRCYIYENKIDILNQ